MRRSLAAAIVTVAAAILLATPVMADTADEIFSEQIIRPSLPASAASSQLASPYAFEFTGEDALRLTVHNSKSDVIVGVHYRMHTLDNHTFPSREFMTPSSDRAASTAEFVLPRGYLQNVTIFATSGSPRRGQTFARLQVIRGRGASAVVLATIVQGYITGNQDRAWPGSALEGSLEGDGYVRSLTGTNPALGSNASETVPTGARWQLLELRVRLTTGVVVATRRPFVVLSQGGNAQLTSVQPGTMVASSAQDWYWAMGAWLSTSLSSLAGLAGLPQETILIAGDQISLSAENISGGDDFDAPIFTVREWLEAQ